MGNAIAITEATNDVTRYSYDRYGNQIRKVDALGHQTDYTYDGSGNILTETWKLTTPNGEQTLATTKTYDTNGKVKTVLDANGGLTKYEYDANGNQTVLVDAKGRRTEMRYDSKNQLLETILPDDTPNTLADNSRIVYAYDALGNKTLIVDQFGRKTLYGQDALNRPTGMVLPDATPNDLTDNPRVDVEYNQSGQMTVLVQDGIRTEFGYDAVGRIILTRQRNNGQVYETKTTYDAAGRKIATTDALNHTTRYVYDALDRLTETDFADGTRTQTTYDGFGNVLVKTDQAGLTTRYEYDALDRLTAVIDAQRNQTKYEYDEAGDLVTQTDANTHITRYEYDGLQRRTAVVRPLGQRSETRYDNVGNVIQTQDFKGNLVTYDFDQTNQLIAQHFLSEGRTITFTTTADGRERTVTDERGTTTYRYDDRGRLLSRREPDNTAIFYTYDVTTGKTGTVTTPSGKTTYGYNSLGQLETVTGAEGTTTYGYNAVGNLSQQTLPNGVTETYQYDLMNRLQVLEAKNSAGIVLSRYRYTYDAVGNKKTVQELDGRTVEYTYDSLYRLKTEAIDLPGTAIDPTFEYEYDKVGNRLWKQEISNGTSTRTVYSYNDNDWLLRETTGGATTIYTYDNNGNTQTKTQGSNSTLYTWNTANQLTGATISTNGVTQQLGYRYDASGVRVAARVNGVETRYLVDESSGYAQVLEEYAPNGMVQARYVYGADISPILQTRAGQTSVYLRDGHSGVRQLTNGTGGVTDSYTYDAYGTLLNSTGTTQNTYQYRGEQSDPNLGMQYLRARYYDQRTGRFASVDPFEGQMESLISRHRYVYGNNNPVTFSDPSGLTSSILEFGVAEKILGLLAAASVAQSYAGKLLGIADGREPIEWKGTQVGAGLSVGLSVSPGATIVSATGTDTSKSYSGQWMILTGSPSVPWLSPYGSAPFSLTAGTFEAKSPRLFGATPIALQRGYLQGRAGTVVIGAGFSLANRFLMGYGEGTSVFNWVYKMICVKGQK